MAKILSYKYRCCKHYAKEDNNPLSVESKKEPACGVHSSYLLNFYPLSLPASGYIRTTCGTGIVENTMPYIHCGCAFVGLVFVCGGRGCTFYTLVSPNVSVPVV